MPTVIVMSHEECNAAVRKHVEETLASGIYPTDAPLGEPWDPQGDEDSEEPGGAEALAEHGYFYDPDAEDDE